jgi:hypothetical protein
LFSSFGVFFNQGIKNSSEGGTQMEKILKKIKENENHFTRQFVAKASVTSKLRINLGRIAEYGKMNAYSINGGYALFPQDVIPWDGATPSFTFNEGRIPANKIGGLVGDSWSVIDLSNREIKISADKKQDGTEGFFLRPSNQLEKMIEMGAREYYRSGYINSNRYYHVGMLDFVVLFGMDWKEWWDFCESDRPTVVMSAKISDTERYLTIRSKADFKGKLTDHRNPVTFRTAIESGEEVFWETKPIQRTAILLPQAVLEGFGMMANYYLPTQMMWDKKVLVSEAPIERCACCGEPLRMKGEKMRHGLMCRNCYFTAEEMRFLAENIKGTSRVKSDTAYNLLVENANRLERELNILKAAIENNNEEVM